MSWADGATTMMNAGRVRSDLLARLGLDAEADDRDVEDAHDHIAEYLEAAPSDIRGWAERRQAEADRIFALLTGPESELQSLARPPPENTTRRLRPSGARTAASSSASSPPSSRSASSSASTGRASPPRQRHSTPRKGHRRPSAAPRSTRPGWHAADRRRSRPTPRTSRRCRRSPTSTSTANDWTNAKAAAQKVLDVDPKNEHGHGQPRRRLLQRRRHSRRRRRPGRPASRRTPNNAELHYDLGFLYMTTGATD